MLGVELDKSRHGLMGLLSPEQLECVLNKGVRVWKQWLWDDLKMEGNGVGITRGQNQHRLGWNQDPEDVASVMSNRFRKMNFSEILGTVTFVQGRVIDPWSDSGAPEAQTRASGRLSAVRYSSLPQQKLELCRCSLVESSEERESHGQS